MSKHDVRVRVVVEVAGKEVATEYIGFEVIEAVINCRPTWDKPPLHQSLFKYLVHYPHSAVKESIASSNTDWEVFEILLGNPSIGIWRAIVSNDKFLEKTSEAILLSMISADQSIAAEIAEHLGSIEENSNVDIDTIVKALEEVGNYQIDNSLAQNGSYEKTVSRMIKHPDPMVSKLAESTLED